jgi:hypothetical protein
VKTIPTVKRLFICLLAIPVLWIMIGSLVNFHQHKIWGKPLLPELVFNKRDKEKNFDFQKILKNRTVSQLNSHDSGIAADPVAFCYFSSYRVSSLPGNFHSLPQEYHSSPGLRAPPLS